MICDPRLRTKSYGSTFLESLPRVPKTSKIEVVERFFEHIKTLNKNKEEECEIESQAKTKDDDE